MSQIRGCGTSVPDLFTNLCDLKLLWGVIATALIGLGLVATLVFTVIFSANLKRFMRWVSAAAEKSVIFRLSSVPGTRKAFVAFNLLELFLIYATSESAKHFTSMKSWHASAEAYNVTFFPHCNYPSNSVNKQIIPSMNDL